MYGGPYILGVSRVSVRGSTSQSVQEQMYVFCVHIVNVSYLFVFVFVFVLYLVIFFVHL